MMAGSDSGQESVLGDGRLHLRPEAVRVEEAVRRVDLVGEPPVAHQAERANCRRLVGGLLERQVQLQRKEREPDPRSVPIDIVRFRRQRGDGAVPLSGIEAAEVRIQTIHAHYLT